MGLRLPSLTSLLALAVVIVASALTFSNVHMLHASALSALRFAKTTALEFPLLSNTIRNMSSYTGANAAQTSQSDAAKPELLGLPSPEQGAAQQLDVNSKEGIRFDALGPMVVNTDGTLSRITNWDQMAPIEKENTLRVLAVRNKKRREALEKKEAAGQQESAKAEEQRA